MPPEPNQQILNYLLGNLDVLCRNFAGYNENVLLSSKLEYILWDRMQRQDGIPVDVFLSSWMMHARSEESTGRMIDVYKGDWNPDGFVLSEQNSTALALELSLRMPSDQSILATELEKIENPDRKKKLSFIMPAASADKTQRDAFFNRLLNAENRNPEPWVLDALYYLHHPLHEGQGMEYIPQSLALLEEIQRTGDIFFPQNWLGATLQHYHQQEVLQMVKEYLENNPALSNNLRQKVYQASDLLFRATGKY